MLFYIASKEEKAKFFVEETAFSGVRKIASKVSEDLSIVTRKVYNVEIGLPGDEETSNVIIAATLGKSAYLEKLEKEKRIDISKMQGKREVYQFCILEPVNGEKHRTLLIAGSDKRGTIYGLFHLSELAGVSPWIWFADAVAKAIKDCIDKEKELQKEYHAIAGGKWDGMMLSEHVGFVHWNDEECQYPLQCYIEPANKPRMIVSKADDEIYTMGGDWTRKTLYAEDFLDPGCEKIFFDIANGGKVPFTYDVTCDADWISLSQREGEVVLVDKLQVSLDKESLQKYQGRQCAHICIQTDFSKVNIEIAAQVFTAEERRIEHYVPLTDKKGLTIEADEFESDVKTEKGSFKVLCPYGKFHAGVKAFPVTEDYMTEGPFLTYQMYLPEDGIYELTFLTAPLNPVTVENHLRMGIQWNEEEIQYVETVSRSYRGGNSTCKECAQEVLDNVHKLVMEKHGEKGRNTVTVFACDPFVLERILVKKAGNPWEEGYLGVLPELFEK